MRRFLILLTMGILLLALSSCTEQREKIAALFRWGEAQNEA